uniref:Uncharacterized protein n=1 Tax=Steinernema glaseri TaxID=37863 RepID=A0A1I7Y5N2_9BILA
MGFLTGPALAFVNSLPNDVRNSYKKLITALWERFNYTEAQATRELARAKQKPFEPAELFAEKILRLVNRAYSVPAGYTTDQQAKIKMRMFINGLRKDTKRVIDRLAVKPKTMKEALEAVREEERLQDDEKELDELTREQLDALINKKIAGQINNISFNRSNSYPNLQYDHEEFFSSEEQDFDQYEEEIPDPYDNNENTYLTEDVDPYPDDECDHSCPDPNCDCHCHQFQSHDSSYGLSNNN